jgi:hypothetical protein
MTINQGDRGGLIIRQSYAFSVGQNGSYIFFKWLPNSDPVTLASGTSSAIKQGTNQLNVIAVAANGSSFDLYVNGQKIDSASDGSYSQGSIGLSADASNNATTVTYQDARVWTI